MSSLSGGPAEKAGAIYETLWGVHAMLDLLNETAERLRVEEPRVNGAEFWIERAAGSMTIKLRNTSAVCPRTVLMPQVWTSPLKWATSPSFSARQSSRCVDEVLRLRGILLVKTILGPSEARFLAGGLSFDWLILHHPSLVQARRHRCSAQCGEMAVGEF